MSEPDTLLVMQHQVIVPSATNAPAPQLQPPGLSTEPPVIATCPTVAPSSIHTTRVSAVGVAETCLRTVRSQPWPTSVTPPVTISCAST